MNVIDLNGRSAIVTGAAQGLGFAIAERLAASGASVALWDLSQDGLEKATQSLQQANPDSRIIPVQVDISDPGSVDQAMEATQSAYSTIDILVNNAGISGPNAPTWEYPRADWQHVIEVNLIGTFLVSRAVVPTMLQAGYGRIVNVASVAGKDGNPNASAYSASKAGIINFTKSLGKELAKTGVLVNCITPAAVRTPLFEQMTQAHVDYMLSKIPMERFGEPKEIASLVAWLSSEECSFSTGAAFDLSGGRATY
jgi:3-oxoacyl-[acyl-carrier protein] reductase